MKGCCAATRAQLAQAIDRRAETETNPHIKAGLLIAKSIVKEELLCR